MTSPLADLLDPNGLQQFATSDQAFFLAAAGSAIRDFCGWHIAPSVAITDQTIPCGERGLITLPSLHVTAIDALTDLTVPRRQ